MIEHAHDAEAIFLPALDKTTPQGRVAYAEVLRVAGRLDDARVSSQRAVALREALVKADPETTCYRQGLAVSLLRSGQVRLSAGDSARAARDWNYAISLFQGLPIAERGELWLEASCNAMLSRVAGSPGSGVSADEGPKELARAMAVLRRAGTSGFRDTHSMRAEAALEPPRKRRDFQLLMLGCAFPANPFDRCD